MLAEQQLRYLLPGVVLDGTAIVIVVRMLKVGDGFHVDENSHLEAGEKL